jgi:hypothetical protein
MYRWLSVYSHAHRTPHTNGLFDPCTLETYYHLQRTSQLRYIWIGARDSWRTNKANESVMESEREHSMARARAKAREDQMREGKSESQEC